jgi:hypothetical protein
MRSTAGRTARIIVAAGLLVATATGCLGDVIPGGSDPPPEPAPGWEEQAAAIDGIVNFLADGPLSQEHQGGPLDYEMLPPVGGVHNNRWMNCQGDVYPEPIANEHAVHSLEHGAVWVTYRPDLPGDQVEALAKRVRGNSHLFMSPFPGLDRPISLQTWGYQLKLDDPADPRIDEFIRVLKQHASPEGMGAPCQDGITSTGTEPRSGDGPRPGG